MMGGGTGLNTLLNQMDSLGELVEDRLRYKILRWLGDRPRAGDQQAARVRHRRDQPARGAGPGPDPARSTRSHPRGLRTRTREGRRDIIEHYLSKKAHDPDIDLEMMVARLDRVDAD